MHQKESDSAWSDWRDCVDLKVAHAGTLGAGELCCHGEDLQRAEEQQADSGGLSCPLPFSGTMSGNTSPVFRTGGGRNSDSIDLSWLSFLGPGLCMHLLARAFSFTHPLLLPLHVSSTNSLVLCFPSPQGSPPFLFFSPGAFLSAWLSCHSPLSPSLISSH